MAVIAMVTKVQKMLNSLQTAEPFETWHKNRSSLKVVLFVFISFAVIVISQKSRDLKARIPQWQEGGTK
jgi:NADH:ubiquinone oxidoreductase subunit 6 (subunit J)